MLGEKEVKFIVFVVSGWRKIVFSCVDAVVLFGNTRCCSKNSQNENKESLWEKSMIINSFIERFVYVKRAATLMLFHLLN